MEEPTVSHLAASPPDLDAVKPPQTVKPIPADPKELVALVLDKTADISRRRRVFAALDKLARKRPAVLDEVISGLSPDAPLLNRWLAAELVLAQPIIPERLDRLNAVARFLSDDVIGVMARIVRSTWISEKGYPIQAGERAESNASLLPFPEPGARLDWHPVLAVDERFRWPSADAERLEDSLLIDADVDSLLEQFADLKFPIANEIVARRGVLRIRAPQIHDQNPRPIKAARKALDLVVVSVTEAVAHGTLTSEHLADLLVLIRFVGRSPDLWAQFDRQRADLTRAAPSDSDGALLWALAMGAMPSMSGHVSAALADIPDEALMALLETAIDLELQGFVGRIQDIALIRARSGTATIRFWERLGKIAPATPQLEKWWRSFMASMAPAGAVAHDQATQTVLFLEEIRTCPAEQLADKGLADRIAELTSQAALRAAGTAISRLASEISTERDRQVTTIATRLRGNAEQIAAALASIQRVLGSVPPAVRTIAEEAQQVLAKEGQRLQVATGVASLPEVRRIVARRAEAVTDVAAALHRLDRPSTEDAQAAEMERLRSHLSWAANERPDLLEPITNGLSTLSGEALSVVVSVAVQHSDRRLFEAIARELQSVQALRAIWRATLTAHASQLGTTVRFDDDLASQSVELLLEQVEELQRRLREVRSENTWHAYTEQGTIARATMQAAVTQLAADIAAVASSL